MVQNIDPFVQVHLTKDLQNLTSLHFLCTYAIICSHFRFHLSSNFIGLTTPQLLIHNTLTIKEGGLCSKVLATNRDTVEREACLISSVLVYMEADRSILIL